MIYAEHADQMALIVWFRLKYKKYKDLLVFVPNGQNVGARAGERLKKLGLCKGFPDLVLFVKNNKYPAMIIEMKSKKGKATKEQNAMHNRLRDAGYLVVVSYGLDIACESIDKYMSNVSPSKWGAARA